MVNIILLYTQFIDKYKRQLLIVLKINSEKFYIKHNNSESY